MALQESGTLASMCLHFSSRENTANNTSALSCPFHIERFCRHWEFPSSPSSEYPALTFLLEMITKSHMHKRTPGKWRRERGCATWRDVKKKFLPEGRARNRHWCGHGPSWLEHPSRWGSGYQGKSNWGRYESRRAATVWTTQWVLYEEGEN